MQQLKQPSVLYVNYNQLYSLSLSTLSCELSIVYNLTTKQHDHNIRLDVDRRRRRGNHPGVINVKYEQERQLDKLKCVQWDMHKSAQGGAS